MNINNAGGRDVLLSASVNIPGVIVELHDEQDRRMIKVKKIVIPSGGTAELKPGGMHIMIYNMPRSIKEGSQIDLSLLFERSGEKRVAVRFEKENESQGGQ